MGKIGSHAAQRVRSPSEKKKKGERILYSVVILEDPLSVYKPAPCSGLPDIGGRAVVGEEGKHRFVTKRRLGGLSNASPLSMYTFPGLATGKNTVPTNRRRQKDMFLTGHVA